MRVLIDLALGILVGRFLLPARWKRANAVLQSAATIAALFLMGVSLGAQGDLLANLQKTGWIAVLVAAGTVAGSLLLTVLLDRCLLRPRRKRKRGGAEDG